MKIKTKLSFVQSRTANFQLDSLQQHNIDSMKIFSRGRNYHQLLLLLQIYENIANQFNLIKKKREKNAPIFICMRW